MIRRTSVRRCRLTLSNPSRNRAWFQHLRVKFYQPLSNFAFNLRRYTWGWMRRIPQGGLLRTSPWDKPVGQALDRR